MRNVVLFPGIVLPITWAARKASQPPRKPCAPDARSALLLQRDPAVEKPVATDLYEIGVLATVVRYVTAPGWHASSRCSGREPVPLEGARARHAVPRGAHRDARRTEASGPQVEARLEVLKQRAIEALALLPQVPAELARTLQSIDSAGQLADLIVSFMDVKPAEKQELLETLDLKERLDKVLKLLAHRVEVLKITRDITRADAGGARRAPA